MYRVVKFLSVLFIVSLLFTIVGCAPTTEVPTTAPQVSEVAATQPEVTKESPPAVEPTKPAAPAEKKVVRYTQLDKRTSDVDGANAMEKAFEEKNPDIDIQVEYGSWDDAHDKYITQAQGGDPPCVGQIAWGWIGEFAKAGLITNLNDKIVNSPYYKDLMPLSVDAAKVDGQVWGAPWFAGLDMLYYNTDKFNEAGVSGPPKTWEELLAIGPSLTKSPDQYAYGWGAGGDIGVLMTLNLAKQFGGTWVDENGNYTVNTEPWIKAIKLQQEFLNQQISPPTTVTDDYVTRAENFEKGYTTMYTAGSWDLKLFEDMAAEAGKPVVGIGTLPYPECDGCGPATFGNGNHWVIFDGCKEKDAAWKWTEYMMSPEAQELWAKNTIFLPVNMQVVNGDFVQNDPYLKIVADAINSAWIPEPTPEIIDFQFNYGRAILQDALLGNLTAEEAAAKMQEELDAHKAARQ